MMTKPAVQINRAPVLTLWGAVVAERLGYDAQASLSLGKALSGLNAQAKGRSLGIFQAKKTPDGGPSKKVGLGEEFWIELCGRGIPAKNTDDGIRAVVKDKPVDTAGVKQYLEKKFGEDLDRVKEAMRDLAESFESEELASRAYSLYEKFRPVIPKGRRGWGAKGDLDLDLIRSLAEWALSAHLLFVIGSLDCDDVVDVADDGLCGRSEQRLKWSCRDY